MIDYILSLFLECPRIQSSNRDSGIATTPMEGNTNNATPQLSQRGIFFSDAKFHGVTSPPFRRKLHDFKFRACMRSSKTTHHNKHQLIITKFIVLIFMAANYLSVKFCTIQTFPLYSTLIIILCIERSNCQTDIHIILYLMASLRKVMSLKSGLLSSHRGQSYAFSYTRIRSQ